jgi:predicted  nucleic acid-binding Zn-ribbon protein
MAIGAGLAITQITEEELNLECTRDQSVAATLNNLVARIRSTEKKLTGEIQEALGALTTDISAALADPLAARQLQQQVQTAQKLFEARIAEISQRGKTQRLCIADDADRLEQRWNFGAVVQEIAQTEQAIENQDSSIQRMIDLAATELTTLMQVQTSRTAMKAYLRGLRFAAETSKARS